MTPVDGPAAGVPRDGVGAVGPAEVTGSLAGRLPAGGRGIVFDPVRSHGCWLVDAHTGEEYLDLCPFYGSAPLGPGADELRDDPHFWSALERVAAVKPANQDTPSVEFAAFVTAFSRVFGDADLPYLFFVEGGALAVENALKIAFDWKSRRNEAAGRPASLGTRVLHLSKAFHGRSGYTMSLTNTDPVKTARFPLFQWPRVDIPAVRFPIDEAAVAAAERHALGQARAAFAAHPDDIACFIAEPIQGEGGDNHMRAEFLQAMQRLCRQHDALFVLDEVQTGGGTTGTAWAYQQLGLAPDVVAFGKKLQLGGVMAGRRLDTVADHVFAVPGRINSTWGGGLVDMVRARHLIEVIERDGLISRAATTGGWLLDALRRTAREHPVVDNVRGRGLMVAFDLPAPELRDRVVQGLRMAGVLVLPSGARSIRLRPALSVSIEDLTDGLTALDHVLRSLV